MPSYRYPQWMGSLGLMSLVGCLILGSPSVGDVVILNPGTLKGTVGLSHWESQSNHVTLRGNDHDFSAALSFTGNTFRLTTEGNQTYRSLILTHSWANGSLSISRSAPLFIPVGQDLPIDLTRPTGSIVNTLTVTGGSLLSVNYSANAGSIDNQESYTSQVQQNAASGLVVHLPMVASTEISLVGTATVALSDGAGQPLCTVLLPLETRQLDLADGQEVAVTHELTVAQDMCSASLTGKVSLSGLPPGVGFNSAELVLNGQGQTFSTQVSSTTPSFQFQNMLPGYYSLSATASFEAPAETDNPRGFIYLPNQNPSIVLLEAGKTTQRDFSFGAAVVDGWFKPLVYLAQMNAYGPDSRWQSRGFIFQGASDAATAGGRAEFQHSAKTGSQYFKAVLTQGRWTPPTAYYEREDKLPPTKPQVHFFYYTPENFGYVNAKSGQSLSVGEFSFKNGSATVTFEVRVPGGAAKPLLSNPTIYVNKISNDTLVQTNSAIYRTWPASINPASITFHGPPGKYTLQAYAYVNDVWTRFPGSLLDVGIPLLTLAGSEVLVTALDGEGEPLPIELRFDEVLEAGETTVSLTDMGPMPPPDRDLLELLGGGRYLSTTTTATHGGEVEFALSYDPSALGLTPEEESRLTLQQFICQGEGETDCNWVIIGTAGTPASLAGSESRVIRGYSSSLGTVALMLPKVPPQVACVGSPGYPVRLVTAPGSCGVTVNADNHLAGNCTSGSKGLSSCTFGGVASLPLGPGLHDVSVLATAMDGQQVICTSYLLVEDAEAPRITCPATAPVLECRADDGVMVSQLPSTADNCAGVSISCTTGSGEPRRPGTTQATCTARDGAGNQASCSFSVTLQDTVAPSITCPTPVSAECSGNGVATVMPPPATATDACFLASVTSPAQTVFPLGLTSVSYTATDMGGHSATCSSTIAVKDTQAPALTLQGGNLLSLACGARYSEPGFTATDTCWGDFTSEVSVSGAVDSSRPGRYTLSYTVADPSGNQSTALRVIDVLSTLLDDGPSHATWSMTGRMALERTLHTLTPLKDGRVLLAGGFNISTQLYDPTTGAWSTTGSPSTSRRHHTATRLSNGRVLIAGGANGEIDATAELYAPATGTWSTTGDMRVPRRHHTATLLSDGRVLVAGGGGSGQGAMAELYGPATGTWSTTGGMRSSRRYHTATLLSDGRVLVAGGQDEGGGILSTAELYDPATGTWSATGSMQVSRRYHTATLLSDGRVLVAGNDGTAQGATAELYDPATGTWSATGSMRVPRHYHTATLLPDGRVLVAGGYDDRIGIQRFAEVYDMCSGTWLSTPAMSVARYNHAAAPLPGGRVLISGGASPSDQGSAELYTPSP